MVAEDPVARTAKGSGRRQPSVVSVMVLAPGSRVVSTPRQIIYLTAEGVEGDRHAGLTRLADSRNKDVQRGTEVRNDRQVTIVSEEELARVAEGLRVPEVRPEWLGANLCLSGLVALSDLPQGTQLSFPTGAVLRVEAQNQPCTVAGGGVESAYPDRTGLASEFPKAAMGLRGLTASVDQPGPISVRDAVDVSFPE